MKKRSVYVILCLLPILFCGCGKENAALSDYFEKPFSASLVAVWENGETVRADVTLGSLPDSEKTAQTAPATEEESKKPEKEKETETGKEPAEGILPRDGSIVYTSPESMTDISAVRHDGVVSVNVSGISLTVSRSVGERYAALLDLLDLRSADAEKCRRESYRGEELRCVCYGGTKVYFSLTEDTPRYLCRGGTTVTFDRFVYTA